jgi:ribosomal protein S18 acetylase RimI-like enzyme
VLEIRPYEDTDESAVIALGNEEPSDTARHNDPATVIRNKLPVDRELFLVAIIDGAVAGTVMGGYDGHRGWVYAIMVSSSCRRKGVGSALIRRLEVLLVGRGCMKVNLQVRASNAGVVAFYEQLGYTIEERISMGKRLY